MVGVCDSVWGHEFAMSLFVGVYDLLDLHTFRGVDRRFEVLLHL